LNKFRVGIGFDTHAFIQGDSIIIGGVKIPFNKSFLAHSDGDVLIHAICDALLGSVGLKDIGTCFPDNDERYKNIDSLVILKQTYDMVKSKGWIVSNIDCNIIIQEPKMKPYIDKMKEIISNIFEIEMEDVSIKAKTSENIGFIGRGEGASAQAIVLVTKQN